MDPSAPNPPSHDPIHTALQDDDDNVQVLVAEEKDLLGVSVHHFVTVFLPLVLSHGYHASSQFYEIENFQARESFVRKQGANTTCPIDGHLGAAYVHTLVGEDHVGPSTAMLSWTWKYSVGSVVETLQDYCQEHRLDPKRTYIWMCCLCVNQHRVVKANKSGVLNKSHLDFENEFRRRVLGIGRLLAMMGPWDDPEYLKRVWCIFECFTAIQNDVAITIVMPPQERQRMSKILLGSCDSRDAARRRNRRSRQGNGGLLPLSNATASSASTSSSSIAQDSNHSASLTPSSIHTTDTDNASSLQDPSVEPPQSTIPEPTIPSTSSHQHRRSHPYRGGMDALYRALANISVQNAQATVPEDRTRIMSILQHSHIGCDAVNQQVANHLRDWVRRAIDVIVNEQVQQQMEQATLEESKDHLDGNQREITQRRYRLTHAAFCTNVAMLFQRNGEFDAAVDMFRKSHHIYDSELGGNHAYTAATLSNIGSILMAQGHHEQALDLHQQALKIQQSLPEAQQKNMATTYANLAQVWHGKGDFDKALKMYKEAAVMFEKFYGPDHQSLAPIYSSIGSLLLLKGNHSDALRSSQRALEIFKVKPGENHPDTAKTYSDIGRIYHGQGKYANALEMQEKAIAIQEKLLGEHVHTATSYLNKAKSLQAMGDYDYALTVYNKTRLMLEHTVGPMHPTTAATFCSLGSLYQARKEYTQSLEFFAKALEYYKDAFGPDHFSTARVYSDMGSVLQDRNEENDREDALDMLQRARTIQESALNAFHPSLATTYLNLGRAMKAKRDYEEGMAMYQKALKIQEKVLGDHPSTASTYSSIASLLAAQGKRAEALAMYQKCLSIQLKVLHPKHPMTVKTKRKIESLK